MDLTGEWSEFDFDLFNYLTSDDDKYSPVCDENIDSFDVNSTLYSSKLFPDLLASTEKELKSVDLSFNIPQILTDVLPQVLNSPKEGDNVPEVNVLTSREETNFYASVPSGNFPCPQIPVDKPRKGKTSVGGKKKKQKNEWLATLLAAPRPSDLNRNVIMDPSHNVQIEAVGVVGSAEDFALLDGRVLLPRVPCQSPAPLPLDRRPLHPPHFRHRYVAALQYRLSRVNRLPIPTEEKKLDAVTITDEEKDLMPEFFRSPSLTARYLKIRNHIVSCWESSRPSYVSKRSIRPGLKNCGDVNLISRVHIYLERKGVINFGSLRCHYLSEVSRWNANEAEAPRENCNKVCDSNLKGNQLIRHSLVA